MFYGKMQIEIIRNHMRRFVKVRKTLITPVSLCCYFFKAIFSING